MATRRRINSGKTVFVKQPSDLNEVHYTPVCLTQVLELYETINHTPSTKRRLFVNSITESVCDNKCVFYSTAAFVNLKLLSLQTVVDLYNAYVIPSLILLLMFLLLPYQYGAILMVHVDRLLQGIGVTTNVSLVQ